MITYKKDYISELCLEYTFGDSISQETNSKVLKLYRYINKNISKQKYEILDVVPTYNSLAIHFTVDSSLFYDSSDIDTIVDDLDNLDAQQDAHLHEIDVDYSGEDVNDVCRELKITKEELVKLHANKTYTIAMIGFRPYFPYLLGLDERLKLPRREDPRTLVKKGSVAIASNQTGIYSEDSPGGWHIIGHTNFEDYNTLKAGDKIIFKELRDVD
jgi:KipI family sensor histidine kinase inhibitor